VGCSFVIDLPDLGGKKRLESMGLAVTTLVEFEGH
jgi:adenine phosphoribosyltransferase